MKPENEQILNEIIDELGLIFSHSTEEDIKKIVDMYHKKQLLLHDVGSSTYKVAIKDSYCTYDFEMKLPKTTCIRDISKRLYASFGLKEEQGKLRE